MNDQYFLIPLQNHPLRMNEFAKKWKNDPQHDLIPYEWKNEWMTIWMINEWMTDWINGLNHVYI